MVLAELRQLAGELNIPATAGMRKGDLIAAIASARAQAERASPTWPPSCRCTEGPAVNPPAAAAPAKPTRAPRAAKAPAVHPTPRPSPTPRPTPRS